MTTDQQPKPQRAKAIAGLQKLHDAAVRDRDGDLAARLYVSIAVLQHQVHEEDMRAIGLDSNGRPLTPQVSLDAKPDRAAEWRR